MIYNILDDVQPPWRIVELQACLLPAPLTLPVPSAVTSPVPLTRLCLSSTFDRLSPGCFLTSLLVWDPGSDFKVVIQVETSRLASGRDFKVGIQVATLRLESR